MRKLLTTLPVTANRLETALRDACASGHWDGKVQLVLDKNVNQHRLELVYDDNTGPCPHQRRVIDVGNNQWYLGCVMARDKDGFSTPCPTCGWLPCERYKVRKEE